MQTSFMILKGCIIWLQSVVDILASHESTIGVVVLIVVVVFVVVLILEHLYPRIKVKLPMHPAPNLNLIMKIAK